LVFRSGQAYQLPVSLVNANDLASLGDVFINNLEDGDSLVYDAVADRWENRSILLGFALANLTDVELTSLAGGDILRYDSGDDLWENVSLASLLAPYALLTDLDDYQLLSEKGQANGYASLDSGGKVPLSQINDAILGQVSYQGTWDADTNTPTLANPPSSTTKGEYYVVSVGNIPGPPPGQTFGLTFEVGDWIISNGTEWEKVNNTDAVRTVFGRLGDVVANAGDYDAFYETVITAGTTAQYFRGDKTFQTLNTGVVPESSNLYFTDARARDSLSFVAGSADYNSTTGVITIPTNNNQITNGAGYITSTVTADPDSVVLNLRGGLTDDFSNILFYNNVGSTLQNYIQSSPSNLGINSQGNTPITFGTNLSGGGGTRMTISGAGAATFSSSVTAVQASIGYTTAAPTNGMIVQGNVLIGTTTDNGNKLQVNGAGRFLGTVSSGDGSVNGFKGFESSTGQFNTSNGLIALGTANPGNGYIIEFQAPDGSYNYATRGAIELSGVSILYSNFSDYRLKTNIKPLVSALERINNLKPVRFNLLADMNNTIDGFLAHEVQEVVPEAVNRNKDAVKENGEPDYQSLDQSKLIPLLTAAIQELKAEIDILKQK
jgi:hypothetical protein